MKIRLRSLTTATVLAAALLTGCNSGNTPEGDTAATAANAPDGSTSATSAPTTFMETLGNSAVIVAANNRVSVQGVAGEQMWSLDLPDGDTVVAPPAGALSSMAYIRGQKNIYAIAPDGKLAWKYPHVDQNARIKAIMALGDSTAAMTVGDTSIVAFNGEGQPRWTFLLPNGDRIVGNPVVAPNSFVYVQGEKMLYCIDSQGGTNWQKEL